jgi:soluble lytic murein transglycosylase-like protein
MKQLLVHCLFMIYMSSAPLGATEGVSSRDMHVWRGEFEHALSAEGGELDRAAYLMLAGDPERSLELLDGSTDSLRLGILSYRTGMLDEAILLLREPQTNIYLEAYRMFYRASALAEKGRDAEAGRELGVLIREDVSSVLGTRPRELFVEVSYRAETEPDSIIAIMGGIDRFYGTSALMLAERLLAAQRKDEAKKAFLRGIEAAPDTSSGRLFNRLFERFRECLETFDGADLAALAEGTLSFGEFSKALKVIEYLESRSPGDYRTRFLKGALFEAERKPRRALEIFNGIFDSNAPLELKKTALLESASIEYGLERYEDSAERYRLFGLYYPGDRRSSYALDIAARIYISRGMVDQALKTWERLRELGTDDTTSREAALSEAALRHARGDSTTAYQILKDVLAEGDWRTEPAVLYWLHRTAGIENEREVWKRRLTDAYPGSFYSIAAEGDTALFRISDDDSLRNAGIVVDRLEWRERRFVESVRATLRPDESLYRDEAFEALVYFLERGFMEEARRCVGILKRLYGSDAVSMAALYATVRSSGLVDVGLKLLWTKGLSGMDSPVDNTLRYPVAYSSFVAKEAVRNELPDELLLAVIREESSFDCFAISRAGALGLMQLMPGTGSWIGRKIRQRNLETDDLLAPEFNIAAGAWYLRYLLNRSGNSVVAALASYNGGETRLSGWRKSFDPAGQPILAIEMIGPRETRRYVKRVLDSMTNYRRISMSDTGLQ